MRRRAAVSRFKVSTAMLSRYASAASCSSTQAGSSASLAPASGTVVLDVRDTDEFAGAHIPGSLNILYGRLMERIGELPRDREIAAVCSGGKRSGLAASLLQREGYGAVIHIGHGGVGTWERGGHPVESS